MSTNQHGARRFISCHLVLTTALLLGAVAVAEAQMTFYAARAGFNAAVPLPTASVDFEAGIISDALNGSSFAAPLDTSTDNGVFSPGDIPADISFSNTCIGSGLILAGSGFDAWGWSGTGGFPSQVLMPDNDACSLSISFTPAANAVAMDIYAETDSGYRVTIYGIENNVLQNVDSAAGEVSPGFFGVVSRVPITRIEMKAPSGTATGAFEAADNLTFRILIFGDGFESGNTNAWSSSAP